MGNLLYDGIWARCYAYITLLNAANPSLWDLYQYFPGLLLETGGSQWVNGSFKVRQLVGDGAGIGTQSCLTPNDDFTYLTYFECDPTVTGAH